MQRNNFWLEIFFKSFELFWIFCRNLWNGSQTFIFVSRVKILQEILFLFSFSEFFRILSENFFQTFDQITSRSFQNYLLSVQRYSLWLEIFFKSFESFWIFCRKLCNGSQTAIFLSRVKNPEEKKFLIFSSDFFRILSEKKFRFLAKKLQELTKLTSVCAEEQFLAWFFIQMFWTVLDFRQKPLAWFSNFYLRVQSENSGRNNFFILLFRVFSGFERKFFSDFWPKNFKKFSKLPSKCPEEQFVAWNVFLKIWIILNFLQKTLQWFSNIYLRVQTKKSERNKFFILLLSLFSDFERKKSDFWPKNFKKLSKLTSVRADEHFLAWNFLQKFWTFLHFLQKPLAWFSKFYLRVQSKISGRNSFFLTFLFRIFCNFERNIFRLLAKKTSRSCQNYPLRVQTNNFWIEIFSKVLNRFGFSAETFGMVLKLLSSCPE